MKRNGVVIKKNLKLKKDGTTVTTVATKIMIPTYFTKSSLLKIRDVMEIVGSFAIIMGDNYGVMNLNSALRTVPDKITTETIDDMEYYVLSYNPGSVILLSNTVLVNGGIVQDLFLSYLFRGKVPWYIDYDDYLRFMDSATLYGGIQVDGAPEVVELLVALACRSKTDVEKLSREDKKKKYLNKDIKFVPLDTVNFTSGSFEKLVGTHQSAGVVSSLVTSTDDVSVTEKITRA